MSFQNPTGESDHSMAIVPVTPSAGGTASSLRRLLVVDPDHVSRGELAGVLSKAGYEVTSTADAARAIRLHEEKRFDLIVLELFALGPGGVEVLLALAGQPGAPGFILLSRKSRIPGEAFLRLAQYLGARYFLPKPFQPEQLLSAVRQALGE
jgi:CheY-like chemotaxis protein